MELGFDCFGSRSTGEGLLFSGSSVSTSAHADQIVYAGPLLDEAEGTPNGSLLILDVPDRASAEAFASGDPYALAGLFRDVHIVPTKQVFPTG